MLRVRMAKPMPLNATQLETQHIPLRNFVGGGPTGQQPHVTYQAPLSSGQARPAHPSACSLPRACSRRGPSSIIQERLRFTIDAVLKGSLNDSLSDPSPVSLRRPQREPLSPTPQYQGTPSTQHTLCLTHSSIHI